MPATGDTIQRYPLLRLLVPYIIGIAFADALWPHAICWCPYGEAVFAVLLLAICGLCSVWRRLPDFTCVLTASALFFTLGICNYTYTRHHISYTWPPHEAVYEARIIDAPRQRARSTLCPIEVTAMLDSTAWHRVERKVLAYMQPTPEADSLQPGDVICFRGKVRTPRNFSEDLPFDYARYVTMQGAAGTVYLPVRDWAEVEEDMPYSLRERLLRLRHTLQQEYMHPVFEGDALGVLSALTLGDKRGLSDEVRAAYTDAGAAHVLALSGMHVGVIYGMLVFMFRGLVRRRSLRWLRELVTIAVLWLFALMVGMSPSVVRAVAMCTLYAVARWVSDGTSPPLHVLSLTALLMLLVHPLYLFDVGFQLSFMAMAAILWLEPHLESLFKRRSLHPLPAYFVGVVSMSLTAQLGVLPLQLYHFGTFSTYFLVTNLAVVPCLSLVLLLSLVWWAFLLLHIPLAHSLGCLLQSIVVWANDALAHIARWPGAVLHVDGYNALAALFTYLFILFAGVFLVKRWPRGAVLALASMLGLLLSLLW